MSEKVRKGPKGSERFKRIQKDPKGSKTVQNAFKDVKKGTKSLKYFELVSLISSSEKKK